jgi:anti-anti-sigma factor
MTVGGAPGSQGDGPTERPLCRSDRFSSSVSPEAGRTVLRVAGELDTEVAPTFWAAIDELTWSGDLVVNAAELSFVDSTGIGCLFKLHHRAEDAGGMLIVTGCRPDVRRPIQATGLHRHIALVDHLT